MTYVTNYELHDIEAMAKLYENYYGCENDIANKEYLEWQYLHNFTGRAFVTVAKDDNGDLIGQQALIPMRFSIYGDIVKAALSVNTYVKKYRQSFTTFYNVNNECFKQAADSGFSFIYGFPNPNAFDACVKLLKYTCIGYVPLLLLPMRPKTLVLKRISKRFSFLIPNVVYKGFERKCRDLAIVSVEKIDTTDFDSFWSLIKDKYPILTVRDSNYIYWRYFQNSRRSYKIFGACNGNNMVGYIVLRIMNVESIRNGMIVDFITLPGNKDAAYLLVNTAIKYFNENCVELIGCLMFQHCEEYDILKSCGFINCPNKFLPQPFPYVLRMLDNCKFPLDPNRKNNWFITMGDYDVT